MTIAKTHAESLAAIKPRPEVFSDLLSFHDRYPYFGPGDTLNRCSEGRQRKIMKTSFWMYDGYSEEQEEWN